MSGGQEKNFSTLGPKLRGNKAQQDYGDKQRQICIAIIDYFEAALSPVNKLIELSHGSPSSMILWSAGKLDHHDCCQLSDAMSVTLVQQNLSVWEPQQKTSEISSVSGQ